MDLLLESEGSDPIKRAQLIKDISHSVSLIPDQITRSVFVPEVAERFDIAPEVIWNEVNNNRITNAEQQQKQAQRAQRPSIRPNKTFEKPQTSLSGEPMDMDVPPEYLDQQPVVKKDDHNEFDLMRILVLYGPLAITHKQLNEKGELEEIETSIAELVCHELDVDELVFDHPTYSKIHQIIADSLSENTLLKTSYFRKVEDQDVVQFVTEVEMQQHELSPNWISKHNIYTKTEKDNASQAVMGAIYSFKASKVEKRIGEIRDRLSDQQNPIDDEEMMNLLAEQVTLEQIKKALSAKLGRIVIR